MRSMDLNDIKTGDDGQLAAICKLFLLGVDLINGHLPCHLSGEKGSGMFSYAPRIRDMVGCLIHCYLIGQSAGRRRGQLVMVVGMPLPAEPDGHLDGRFGIEIMDPIGEHTQPMHMPLVEKIQVSAPDEFRGQSGAHNCTCSNKSRASFCPCGKV